MTPATVSWSYTEEIEQYRMTNHPCAVISFRRRSQLIVLIFAVSPEKSVFSNLHYRHITGARYVHLWSIAYTFSCENPRVTVSFWSGFLLLWYIQNRKRKHNCQPSWMHPISRSMQHLTRSWQRLKFASNDSFHNPSKQLVVWVIHTSKSHFDHYGQNQRPLSGLTCNTGNSKHLIGINLRRAATIGNIWTPTWDSSIWIPRQRSTNNRNHNYKQQFSVKTPCWLL